MEQPRPVGCFPKAQRILKRSQFRAVQAEARRVVTPHFVMLLRARTAATGSARLGVTASRKVGNAVVRNRVKRLVREAFRATRSLWSPQMDLVVIVRHRGKDLKLSDVTSEWMGAARQIERKSREALALGQNVSTSDSKPVTTR